MPDKSGHGSTGGKRKRASAGRAKGGRSERKREAGGLEARRSGRKRGGGGERMGSSRSGLRACSSSSATARAASVAIAFSCGCRRSLAVPHPLSALPRFPEPRSVSARASGRPRAACVIALEAGAAMVRASAADSATDSLSRTTDSIASCDATACAPAAVRRRSPIEHVSARQDDGFGTREDVDDAGLPLTGWRRSR